jgi:hypothetical protein
MFEYNISTVWNHVWIQKVFFPNGLGLSKTFSSSATLTLVCRLQSLIMQSRPVPPNIIFYQKVPPNIMCKGDQIYVPDQDLIDYWGPCWVFHKQLVDYPQQRFVEIWPNQQHKEHWNNNNHLHNNSNNQLKRTSCRRSPTWYGMAFLADDLSRNP